MVMFSKVMEASGGFEALRDSVDQASLEDFSDRIYALMCNRFASADYMTGVDWVLRQHLCAKKIALSALFFTQAQAVEHLRMKNLRFYTCYYALFNGLSSNLLVHPAISLKSAHEISHSSLFKEINNYFVRFDIYDEDTIQLLSDIRFTRELYSYHLPLAGSAVRDGESLHVDTIYERLVGCLDKVLQVSNLLSFLAYLAWEKKVGRSVDEYQEHKNQVDDLFFSIITKSDHLQQRVSIDDADYQSFGYAISKIRSPFPISWFIDDKLLDDLEANWERDEDCESGAYRIEDLSQYLRTALDM